MYLSIKKDSPEYPGYLNGFIIENMEKLINNKKEI